MGSGTSRRPDKYENKFEITGKVTYLKNYLDSPKFVKHVRSFALHHRSKFLKYSEVSLTPPVNTTSRLELEQRKCFTEFQELVVPLLENFIAEELDAPSNDDMRVLAEGVLSLRAEQKTHGRKDPALDKVEEICNQCTEFEAFAQMMVKLCNVSYYNLGEQLRIEEDACHEFKRGRGRHGRNGSNSFTNVVETMAKYLVAFFNAGGGVIYFGIEDDGKVIGVPLSTEDRDKLRQLVATEVLTYVRPELPIRPSAPIELVDTQATEKGRDGITRPLFVIEAVARPWCHNRGDGAHQKPYTHRGKPWAKVQSITKEMTPAMIEQWRQPGSRMRIHTRHDADDATNNLPVFKMNLVPVIGTDGFTSTTPVPRAATRSTRSSTSNTSSGAHTFISTVTHHHSRSVAVHNLSWHVTSEDLYRKFSTVGTVVDAVVKANEDKSKIFGIVTFATSEDTALAIETMNGLKFEGRTMYVHEERSRSKERSNKKPKAEACRDFLRGKCRRGDRCKFSHEITPSQQYPQKKVGNKRYKSKPCFYFQKGECRRGDSCWYSHDPDVCRGSGGGRGGGGGGRGRGRRGRQRRYRRNENHY